MRDLILDAGPLITACKFGVANRLVIDYILERSKITIASSVRDEVVISGARYSDARAAYERIEQGRIGVLEPQAGVTLRTLVAPYELGNGERDSILLTEHNALQDATLVIDDHLAYLVSDRLGRRKRFLLDVIVDVVRTGDLDAGLAADMVAAIRTRYPPAFVEHTRLLLQR